RWFSRTLDPGRIGAPQSGAAEPGAGALSRAMGLPLRARRVSVSHDVDRPDCAEPATVGPSCPGAALRRIHGPAARDRRARAVRPTSSRRGLHRTFPPPAVGPIGMSAGPVVLVLIVGSLGRRDSCAAPGLSPGGTIR